MEEELELITILETPSELEEKEDEEDKLENENMEEVQMKDAQSKCTCAANKFYRKYKKTARKLIAAQKYRQMLEAKWNEYLETQAAKRPDTTSTRTLLRETKTPSQETKTPSQEKKPIKIMKPVVVPLKKRESDSSRKHPDDLSVTITVDVPSQIFEMIESEKDRVKGKDRIRSTDDESVTIIPHPRSLQYITIRKDDKTIEELEAEKSSSEISKRTAKSPSDISKRSDRSRYRRRYFKKQEPDLKSIQTTSAIEGIQEKVPSFETITSSKSESYYEKKSSVSKHTFPSIATIKSAKIADTLSDELLALQKKFPATPTKTSTSTIKIRSRKKLPFVDQKSIEEELRDIKFTDKKIFDQKSLDQKSFDQKSFDQKLFDQKLLDQKLFDQKSFDEISFDQKSFDQKSFDQTSFDQKLLDQKSFDQKSVDRESIDKKSFDQKSIDRESIDKKSIHKRSPESSLEIVFQRDLQDMESQIQIPDKTLSTSADFKETQLLYKKTSKELLLGDYESRLQQSLSKISDTTSLKIDRQTKSDTLKRDQLSFEKKLKIKDKEIEYMEKLLGERLQKLLEEQSDYYEDETTERGYYMFRRMSTEIPGTESLETGISSKLEFPRQFSPKRSLSGQFLNAAEFHYRNYMKQHHIEDLFKFLGVHLTVNCPENPVFFLITFLDLCLKYREGLSPPPILFKKQHLESLFDSFDPMKTGLITIEQYFTAMYTLGVEHYNKFPDQTDEERLISKQIFVQEALKQQEKHLKEILRPINVNELSTIGTPPIFSMSEDEKEI